MLASGFTPAFPSENKKSTKEPPDTLPLFSLFFDLSSIASICFVYDQVKDGLNYVAMDQVWYLFFGHHSIVDKDDMFDAITNNTRHFFIRAQVSSANGVVCK